MKPLIIANWKANKTIVEANSWTQAVKNDLEKCFNVQVVVCGSFITLPTLETLFRDSSVKVGAQNVSKFPAGAFTGEVTGEMLSGLVEYCIVGHSERQKYFGENPKEVVQKIQNLLATQITPILCITSPIQLETYLGLAKEIEDQKEKIIFVYEPPSAISGGGDFHPETSEVANANCQAISEKLGGKVLTIYGGSVNPENIQGFLKQPFIHGALPGQASLKAERFLQLVKVVNEVGDQ